MATIGSSLTSINSVLAGGLSLLGYRRGVNTPNINHFSNIDVNYPSLASFNGKIYPTVSLAVTNAIHSVGTPATATATLTYSSSGSCSGTNGSPASGTWLLAGVNSNYEIYLNHTAGNPPTGDAVNTWISLSTTASWSLSVSNNIKSSTGIIKIRDTLNNVELGSSAYSIEVEST